MSLDLPSALPLHPNQALAVEQAACWVQRLIDDFRKSITKVTSFKLDAHALHKHVGRLETLLPHAGVLEQQLCGMCFFLSAEHVRYVVAIIVATHHHLSLLEDPALDTRVILDDLTIEDMADYLKIVVARIHAMHETIRSEWHGTIENSLPLPPTVPTPRRSDSPPLDPVDLPRIPRLTLEQSTSADDAYARLAWFLHQLSPEDDTVQASLSTEADKLLLDNNFTPLRRTVRLPHIAAECSLCASGHCDQARAGPSSLSVPRFESSTPRTDDETRIEGRSTSPISLDSYPTYVDDSAAGLLSKSPATLRPPLPCPSMSSPPSTSRKRRAAPSEDPHPLTRKRQKTKAAPSMHFPCFGTVGSPSSAPEVVASHVGRAIYLTSSLSPSGLPSRVSTISPSPLASSRPLSPMPLSGIPSDSLLFSVPERQEEEESDSYTGMGRGIKIRTWSSDLGESDAEGSDAMSFATAEDGSALGLDGMDDVEVEDVLTVPGRFLTTPEGKEDAFAARKGEEEEGAALRLVPPSNVQRLSSKAAGKRRCLAGLVQTFKHIFSARR